MLYTKAEFISF